MKRFMLVLILSGFAVHSLAEMYKWTDEEGNVQYTQTPPPRGTQSTTVKGISTNSVSGSQPPSPVENSEASKASTEVCLKLQNDLKTLQSGVTVISDKKNPGKFVSMPEEMRRERELEMKASLEKNCKDFAVPKETSAKESSECEKVRAYLEKLTSKEDWLMPHPENPEEFIKIDQETRQKKIAEAQVLLKETCPKQP